MRILTAAAIAIGLGVPIGLLMGLSRWAKGVFDTPIEFYWPLPPLAYLPLMIIWLGIGEISKIALLRSQCLRRSPSPRRRACGRCRRSASTRRCRLARTAFSSCARSCCPPRCPKSSPEPASRSASAGARWSPRSYRGDARRRAFHHVRVPVPGDGRRLRRHRHDRGLRLRVLFRHAPPGSAGWFPGRGRAEEHGL